jgi:SAM-dependent methyltransferase
LGVPTWDELFKDERFRASAPEAELFKFLSILRSRFADRPLYVWDLGCGAGRHTAALAEAGNETFASDCSPRAVQLTQELLQSRGLQAKVALGDMAVSPWPEQFFHGIFSWDVIHHNRLAAIRETMAMIHRSLLPGGLFIGTFLSDKAGNYGQGTALEPGTFVMDDGPESGVPHHFFDEAGIRKLFKDWELLILAEEITRYVETAERFWEWTPFRFTKWNVLARKK